MITPSALSARTFGARSLQLLRALCLPCAALTSQQQWRHPQVSKRTLTLKTVTGADVWEYMSRHWLAARLDDSDVEHFGSG